MKSKTLSKLLVFIILLSISSCGRVFYYSNSKPLDCIQIDTASQFYIRKLYLNKQTGIKELTSKKTDNGIDNILYDIQFLIIKENQVIYITTIPSKYEYDKTDTYLIEDKYPNAFFFNSFYFGKTDSNHSPDKRFVFENDNSKQVWDLKVTGNNLKLNSVDEDKIKRHSVKSTTTMKTENSFSNDVIFEKVIYPMHIGFKVPFDVNEESKTLNFKSIESDNICFIRNVSNNEEVQRLIINFNGYIYNMDYKSLEFSGKRVPFFIKY